jgi:uncharacterized membrane protein YraQ (UPF0718 family)
MGRTIVSVVSVVCYALLFLYMYIVITVVGGLIVVIVGGLCMGAIHI